MTSNLAELLRESAAPALRAQLDAVTGLEAKLDALYERARTVWQPFDVARDVWVRHLARHLAPQVERGLDAVHPDLYFAAALTLRQPAALARFADLYRPKLLAQLSRGNDRALAEDIVAAVEERLLVGGPRGARIADYSGRGSLERFVRAVAANELLNGVRGVHPEPLTDAMVERFADAARNPELAAVSRESRRAFAGALHEALKALAARDRLLLRLHAVEGATISELGLMFEVHKVTAFRWLEEARLRLRNETRRRLRDAYALGEAELDSLLGGSSATLEVSLKSIFTSSVAASRSGVSG
ncbi:MAG: hypothetical protein JNK82_34390 [Myxococcaceae bacterium]|nr:hypothetical protein [Myxococcaceae bacterium]